MDLTLNDFFCGCGGLGLGFKQAGFDILAAWDFNKFAVQSYAANIGNHVQQKDIKEMIWQDVPKASVWSFGFPCQDLSVAGAQAGMKVICKSCGHDFVKTADLDSCPNCKGTSYKAANRSGLFYEVMRLLEEVEENAPENLPAVIMAENVKGLNPYIPVLEEEYKKRGYTANIKLFNSKYWGVPQNRERYFIVGTRNDLNLSFSFPVEQTEFVPKLSTVLDKNVPEKFYMATDKSQELIKRYIERYGEPPTPGPAAIRGRDVDNPTARISGRPTVQNLEVNENGTSNCVTTVQKDNVVVEVATEPHLKQIGMLNMKGNETIRRVYDAEGIAPTTTTTSQGGHRQAKIVDPTTYRVRKLTPTEYGRLQGFPMDTWKQVVSNSQAYKQFGNAVTVAVSKAIAEKVKEALITID